jgi:hypothetical protein
LVGQMKVEFAFTSLTLLRNFFDHQILFSRWEKGSGKRKSFSVFSANVIHF